MPLQSGGEWRRSPSCSDRNDRRGAGLWRFVGGRLFRAFAGGITNWWRSRMAYTWESARAVGDRGTRRDSRNAREMGFNVDGEI